MFAKSLQAIKNYCFRTIEASMHFIPYGYFFLSRACVLIVIIVIIISSTCLDTAECIAPPHTFSVAFLLSNAILVELTIQQELY